MSRPVFLILIFYLLFVTVAFAYFVAQYLERSSLSEEVEGLEAQVARLQRMCVVNDELKQNNSLLEAESKSLSGLVGGLKNETAFLEAQVDNLIVEIETCKEAVIELQQVNASDVKSSRSLNQTNAELVDLVQTLNATNTELEESNKALTNQTNLLQDQLSTLLKDFNEVSATALESQDEVTRLEEEKSQWEALTQSRGTIDSFLDETSHGVVLTYPQLMDQLEEQIINDRRLVLGQLQNTLLQRTQLWSCDFRNAFSGATFVQSFNEPIGSANYESVMTYVRNRVLTDLCADRNDVENYLTINYAQNGVIPLVEITSNQLIEGVSNYSREVLNYYFPTGEETGLTPQDWADALYTCDNLPPEKQFIFVL
jgi:uncharacterized phage infection (PIP) family protein YhgE